jgi:hypothetical protein
VLDKGEVQFGGSVVVILPQGPGHAWESPNQRTIDSDEIGQGGAVFGEFMREGLSGQFAEDVTEEVGIEDVGGLGEGSEADASPPGEMSDVVEFGGLLESSEAGDGGIEEIQEEEGGVAIKVQFSVVGGVAVTAVRTEPFEEGSDAFEVLEAL